MAQENFKYVKYFSKGRGLSRSPLLNNFLTTVLSILRSRSVCFSLLFHLSWFIWTSSLHSSVAFGWYWSHFQTPYNTELCKIFCHAETYIIIFNWRKLHSYVITEALKGDESRLKSFATQHHGGKDSSACLCKWNSDSKRWKRPWG